MRYEIRAMCFAEMLDTGFRVVRDHAALLIGTAALLYVPVAILDALAFPGLGSISWPLLGVALLIRMIAAPVVFCAITFAVGEIYLGRATSVADSLRAGVSLLVPMTGTLSLYYLWMTVATLLFVFPAVYLFLAWGLIWQVMVLEGRHGSAALRRSRELMRGNLLRAAGVLLVSGVLVVVLSGLLAFALAYLPIIGPIGSGLAEAAGVVYGSTVTVILYFDIRSRREAFDVDHLERLVVRAEAAALA